MRPTEKGGAMRLLRRCGIVALLCAAYPFLVASASQADLRVCNKTTSRVGIAIGYKADRDWTTEGWWTVDSD